MMPINLTRTNLLVYSCFWLFFSSTNMLSFLCLVTISVSQCLLTGGHLCFFLTMKFVPSQLGFLGVGWASLLGWGTARALPLRLQGQGCCWIRSPPSEDSPSALWLDSLYGLGQAVKALAALPVEGLCEQSRLSPSWGSLQWVEGLSVVQPSPS